MDPEFLPPGILSSRTAIKECYTENFQGNKHDKF